MLVVEIFQQFKSFCRFMILLRQIKRLVIFLKRSQIDVLKGSRLFTEAVAVGIHDIRGIRPKSLAGYFDGMDCSFAADVIEALYDLLSRKREEDFIYIAGSLYLVGEVKAWFRRKSDD